MDATATVAVRLQQVFQLQRRLAEQRLGALLLERRQAPLQGLRRGAGEQRTILAEHLGMVAQVPQQGLEILEIEQQQAFTIGHLERGVERRLLTVGQLQQVAQQQWPHLAEGGTQRMAAASLHVPQRHRISARLVPQPGHAGDAFSDLARRRTGGAQTAQVALDISGEHRDSRIAELLGQAL